jgi:low molecular weight protein-tyrosine phosphatase
MGMEPLKSESPRWKRIARRLVPARLQEHLRELRELSGAERRAHLGAIVRRLASPASPVPPSLDANGSILFVCYGNIIRSALAAALTRRHGAALDVKLDRVQSAGLGARAGREADARAVAAGRGLGVDLADHRAQPLSRALVDGATVIYVMDRMNEAQLLARFPDAAPKLRRLGALAITEDGDVIGDPYVLDAEAVAAVAARIDRATRELVAELARRAVDPVSHRP